MNAAPIQYSYGPVPSRRLGKSLGINNIAAKVCTYSCVYCQVGRTTRLQSNRCFFYPPELIFEDVRHRLSQTRKSGDRVDYMTFVPDGEPTLDAGLGREISLLKPLNVPIGVITNGSLLWRDDVRDELTQADWISVKIDAAEETVWRRINRPHKDMRLSLILDGVGQFAGSFKGKIVTETMLVKGLNDNDASLTRIAGVLHGLQPHTAYLSIPTRPPAESWAGAPDETVLNRAFQIFRDNLPRVEYLTGYEGNEFSGTGQAEKDLLGITAVHPMRKEAVMKLLSRSGATWELVDRLLQQKSLAEIEYKGHVYYLRKVKPVSNAAR